MTLNNNQIEKLATDAVSTALMNCSVLDPFISSNDKTPSWDGEILVYNSKSFTKENLLGKVPAQVKGKERKRKIRKATFSCEITDLKNYYNDGGCIFFLVYINSKNKNEPEVYYRQLLVFDLARILKDGRGKKKTSITLEPLPTTESELKNIFVSFLTDRQKQTPFIGKEIPTIQSLEEKGVKIKNLLLTVSDFALRNDTLPNYLLSHETYVYAEVEGNDNEIVLDKLTPENTSILMDGDIVINGKLFFDQYLLSKNKGETIIQLGTGIHLNIDSKQLTISLNKQETLDELINETEFFIELVKTKFFEFKGEKLEFNINRKNIPDVDQQIKHLKYLKDVKRMLDILGVKERLNIKKLTDNDFENLRNFTNHIIYGAPIKFTNVNTDFFYGPFLIGNLTIWIFGYLRNKEKSSSQVTSFFSPVQGLIIHFDEDDADKERPVNISQYFLIDKDGLASASNIDFQAIYKDLTQIPKEEIYIENLIYFILELISAYDIKKTNKGASDSGLLKLAFDLLSWLETNNYSEIDVLRLNKLQVIRRHRTFNQNEIKELYAILDSGNDSVKCGASILLDHKDQARFYLEKLDQQEREKFMQYPIYNLLTK